MKTQTMKENAIIDLTIKTMILLAAAGAATGAEKTESADKSGETGWQVLFDGKTLKGWSNPYTWGKAEVTNGEIHLVANKKFFLLTEKQYADFVFEAEVRMPEGKSNSGIMFRCHKKPNRVWGYQAEVDTSERKWSGGLYDEGRRGWLHPNRKKPQTVDAFRKKADGSFKRLGWNKYRVECVGDRIRIWVNGVMTTDFRDSADAGGHIGLQHHGEKGQLYRFRNIRIKALGAGTGPAQTATGAGAARDSMGAACPAGGIVLLDESGDVSRWQAEASRKKIGWKAKGGVITIKPGSGSIITKKMFGDFRLHLEFNVPAGGRRRGGGNSGVYIQRRYEVQILNSFGKAKPSTGDCGALYKTRAADVNACRPAGQWQTYDIEFHAPRWTDAGKKTGNARITVVQNGKKIHDDVEIPNKTGGGLPEGRTHGPIKLQDHGYPVKFRNIWIVPLKP